MAGFVLCSLSSPLLFLMLFCLFYCLSSVVLVCLCFILIWIVFHVAYITICRASLCCRPSTSLYCRACGHSRIFSYSLWNSINSLIGHYSSVVSSVPCIWRVAGSNLGQVLHLQLPAALRHVNSDMLWSGASLSNSGLEGAL